MKRLLSYLLTVLICSACEHNIGVQQGPEGQIVFDSCFSTMKSSFTEDFQSIWETSDMIGIYGYKDGRKMGVNALYQTDVNKQDPVYARFLPVDNTLQWVGGGTYKFYAYSPYNTNASDITKIPFEIPAFQVQKTSADPSGFADYDIKISKVSTERSGTSFGGTIVPTFTFSHLFTIVQLDLKAAGDMIGRKVVKASLTSDSAPLAGEGTFNLYDDKLPVSIKDRSSSTVILEMENYPELSESATSLYYIVLPSGNKVDLSINLILDNAQVVTLDYDDVRLEKNSHITLNALISSEFHPNPVVELPVTVSFESNGRGMSEGAVLGNTVAFFNGMSILREDAPIRYIANDQQPSFASSNWSLNQSYVVSIPFAQEFSGTLEMDFTFVSRGLALWVAEWSSDKIAWNRSSSFSFYNSTELYPCKATFNIPQTETIPSGGNLYLRLRPADMTPCTEGSVPYVNKDTDPRLVYSMTITGR